MTLRNTFTLSRRPLLIASTCIVFAGCGGGGSSDGGSDGGGDAGGSGKTVTMKDNAFDPQETSVKVGETVTFDNQDDRDHNVRGGGIDIDNFDSGSEEFTPDEAGTIEYECTIHEGMTGTLEVEAEA